MLKEFAKHKKLLRGRPRIQKMHLAFCLVLAENPYGGAYFI
jgi:hypothetical protein